MYSRTSGCESLLLSKPLPAHTHTYTPSAPVHQCHSRQLLSFTWQPHTHPPLLSQTTPIPTEIPPDTKASPHLPRQTVNNPHSSRVPSPAVPVCRGSGRCPRSHGSHPAALSPVPPSAKACRHRLSPDKAAQEAVTTTLFAAMPSHRL